MTDLRDRLADFDAAARRILDTKPRRPGLRFRMRRPWRPSVMLAR